MSTAVRPKAWRTGLTRTKVVTSAVVIHAAVQSMLVLGDPVPRLSWAFVALTLASAGALTALLWLTSCAVNTPGRGGGAQLVELRADTLVWSAALLVATMAVALWNSWASLGLIIVGAAVLTTSGSGVERPVRQTATLIRRRPWGALFAALVSGVATFSSWTLALAVGFFLTGPGAAALTWIWSGACVVASLKSWSKRLVRADEEGGDR